MYKLIHHLLRIGRANAFIDNVSAGVVLWVILI